MRLGWEGWTPVIYWKEASTGKRIEEKVYAMLISSEFVNRACEQFKNDNSRWKNSQWVGHLYECNYDNGRLVEQIASQIKSCVDYAAYKAAPASKKKEYAAVVAQKIVDWMTEQLGTSGLTLSCKETNFEIDGEPRNETCVYLKVKITPQIPTRDEIGSLFSQIEQFKR